VRVHTIRSTERALAYIANKMLGYRRNTALQGDAL